MIDIRPLFKPSFWFDFTPEPLTPFMETGLFATFGIMALLGAVIRIVAKSEKYSVELSSIFRKIGSMLTVMGINGFVLYFFTFEGVYILGARFWFLIWFVGVVAWLVAIWYDATVVKPNKGLDAAARRERNKYQPRRSR